MAEYFLSRMQQDPSQHEGINKSLLPATSYLCGKYTAAVSSYFRFVVSLWDVPIPVFYELKLSKCFFLNSRKNSFSRITSIKYWGIQSLCWLLRLLWDVLAHLQVSQQPWTQVAAGQRDLMCARASGSGYKWFTPHKGVEQPVLLFHLKRQIAFTWTDFPFVYKRGKDFNSMETRMGFWRWPSCLPIAWSSLWLHWPFSVTDIITGAPGKVNVLVWGGVVNNKKKGTGCPEPSMEGAAQPVVPQAPETGPAVTVPKSFFFRNGGAASAFGCCRVCRCCRNHCGQRKNKSCWVGGCVWKQPQANKVLS